MKHAIIVGHPDAQSFNVSVANAYAEAAAELGHETVLRDLYRIGFDPCLKATERPDAPNFTIADDVRIEQDLLTDCDVFVLVYPIWLGAPPAILKGYIERVFNHGFAFDAFHAGRAQPLLTGKKMISFTSSGSTRAWLEENGVWESLRTIFDDYVAKGCGLEVVDHHHFPSVNPGLGERWVIENLATVRGKFRSHFGGASTAP